MLPPDEEEERTSPEIPSLRAPRRPRPAAVAHLHEVDDPPLELGEWLSAPPEPPPDAPPLPGDPPPRAAAPPPPPFPSPPLPVAPPRASADRLGGRSADETPTRPLRAISTPARSPSIESAQPPVPASPGAAGPLEAPAKSERVLSGLEAMPTLELAAVEAPVREPVRTSSESICEQCGTPTYPTLRRCPRCQKGYRAPRESAAPARTRRARRRGPGRLLVGLLLLALVGGLAVLYHQVLGRRNRGAPPSEAVVRFYQSLAQGRLGESVEFLHPRHQLEALRLVSAITRAGHSGPQVLGQLLHLVDGESVRIATGQTRDLDDNLWEVELVVHAGSVPLPRGWHRAVRDSGVWYLDENPLAKWRAAQRKRSRVAALPPPGPVMTAPPLPKADEQH